MNTLSANEVVTQVDGLHTVKTLKRWRKTVEENFGLNYFRHGSINDRPSETRYSLDEVKRFQLVALILSGQPSNRKNLHQAIMTAFSTEEPYLKPKTGLEILEEKLSGKNEDLAREDRRLLDAIQEINRRIKLIERRLPLEKESKSKVFRKK